MSCICNSPVRPSFKDSYKDLLDKPSINGVTLDGALTAADLGIKAGAQFKIVTALPITDIDEATVYLVPAQVGQDDNIYQEWIYINNKWEKIGEPINIEPSGGMVSFCPEVHLDITQYIHDHPSLDTLDNLRDLFYLNYSSDTEFPFKDNTLYVCLFSGGISSVSTDSISFWFFSPGDPGEFQVNIWGGVSTEYFSISPNDSWYYAGKFILIKNGKLFFESTTTYKP